MSLRGSVLSQGLDVMSDSIASGERTMQCHITFRPRRSRARSRVRSRVRSRRTNSAGDI